MKMRCAIIGAGAAGCFAAIAIKRFCPQAEVSIFEAGRKPLAKVSVTGGGRCNLTNTFEGIRSLAEAYPRGERLMKRLFHVFGHEDAMAWFEAEGVRLTVQPDHCVFPASQDAMEIVGTLLRLVDRHGIRLLTGHRVARIERTDGGEGGAFGVYFAGEGLRPMRADVVLVATGGCNAAALRAMLPPGSVDVADTVPSLFSLCLPGDGITELAGTVVEDVAVGIPGTKFKAGGPLLVTHWGVSGPAVLKLSAYAARHLHAAGYETPLAVNWMGGVGVQETVALVDSLVSANAKKQLASAYPEVLNGRLWRHILAKSGLRPDRRWGELGRKGLNKIVSVLTNDTYAVGGKCRFKEEFVTCGGVELASLSPNTLESKRCPGLYFAGEATDVDGITGGFNLQAAWTMGFVAAKAIASVAAARG